MEFKHTITDYKRAYAWLEEVGMMEHVISLGVDHEEMGLVIAANAVWDSKNGIPIEEDPNFFQKGGFWFKKFPIYE